MNKIYKTNPDYIVSTISGLSVIIPISENCPKFNGMMKLSGIGPFLWEIFSEGSTIEDAALKVENKYNVSFNTALSDIKEFIGSLSEHGLVFCE